MYKSAVAEQREFEEVEREEANSRELFRMLCRAWKKEKKLSPTDWCVANVEKIPYSPRQGGFSIEAAPQMREVIDTILDKRVRLVSIIASTQSSKTLSPEMALLYIIANDPGPALWLDAVDSTAKNQSESRLQPLFENCPPVKRLFPADKNKKRVRSIFFDNGMQLWIDGAHNLRNLQSKSIRWLFGDETWEWAEGRMAEAEARVSAFGRMGKCIFFSQASKADDDTDKKYKTTDQREWSWKCPHCGEIQPFLWEHIHWDPTAKNLDTGEWDYQRVRETTYMTCRNCDARFENAESVRGALAETARFVPTNTENATFGAVGFHWNALVNQDWGVLAEMYLRAKARTKRGDIKDLAAFYQKKLALPWHEELGEYESAVKLSFIGNYALGSEDWGEEGRYMGRDKWVRKADFRGSPKAAKLRFMTVDVQTGYFYFVVRMWSPNGNSRLLARGTLRDWSEISKTRDEWSVDSHMLFVDGGFMSQEVAEWCAANRAVMLRGDRMAGRFFFREGGVERVYGAQRWIRYGGRSAESYYFSTLSCKDKLLDLQRNDKNIWEVPSNVGEEYLKQMNSETRKLSTNGKPIWIRKGSRANHFWDCESMQVAAAFMNKILKIEKNGG